MHGTVAAGARLLRRAWPSAALTACLPQHGCSGSRRAAAVAAADPAQKHNSGTPSHPSRPRARRVPIADSTVITFGRKHQGRTFSDVLRDDPDYCQWVLHVAFEGVADPALLPFALYLQRASGQRDGSRAGELPPPEGHGPPGAAGGATEGSAAGRTEGRPSSRGDDIAPAPAAEVPHCKCGKPAVKMVAKSKQNPGRHFFRCAQPQGRQCTFFEWAVLPSAAGGGEAARRGAASPEIGRGAGGTSPRPGSSAGPCPAPGQRDSAPRSGTREEGDGGSAEPGAHSGVCGLAGCLNSRSFVITGTHWEMSREQVEQLIRFFGGTTRCAVSSRTSFLLVLGPRLQHWRNSSEDAGPVQQSKKFQDAQSRGIPILEGVEALHSLISNSRPSGSPGTEGAERQLICFEVRPHSG
uniref:Uncharacterized protein n=1 Tax=Alexandrium monilatum TaxID=311494 RepID=A0A7S4Q8R5_9DINO|mmetsp:Transcript_18853/g.59157  ORF Transcript_18853/g.59157 Transcript_18853/m.59157 type:complete len:410 (-) Transcript_18853:191-1420(-)